MSENLQDPNSNNHEPLKSTTTRHDENFTDDSEKSFLSKESQSEKNDGTCKCQHPTHHRTQLNSADLMNLMPSEYWKNFVHGQRFESGGELLSTEQAIRAINEIFVQRLHELENNAPNVLEAQVETYKDWIAVQQRVNKVLLNDFDRFERSFHHHLESHEISPNPKFRHDIAAMVELIKNAFHTKIWSLADLKFESMTPAYVMGLNEDNPDEREILDQLLKGEYKPKPDEGDIRKKRTATDVNIKALAIEVAEKHDEINRLKQQICALEDEIQNAQKKIQLKDDVIRELRLELRKLNKSLMQESAINSTRAPPIREHGHSATKGNISEDVMMSQQENNVQKFNSSKSQAMPENLELVRNQLQEILNSTNCQTDCSPNEAECLKKIFMKLEKDKNDAQERLKKLKEGLLGFLMPGQREEQVLISTNNDEFLIQAVQARVESINLSRQDLNEQVQMLLIEKGATNGKLEALNNINQRNCEALGELADLLSSLTNEPVSYEEMYEPTTSKNNPFCRAIRRIHSKLTKEIDQLTEELAVEKEKYRKTEEQTFDLEKSSEETSSSKLCCIRSSVRSSQRTTTEQSPTPAPRPHPRQKLKKLQRKN